MREAKLTFRDLEDGANAAESRGLDQPKIMKQIHQHTDGMSREEKRAFVSEFYDRSKK